MSEKGDTSNEQIAVTLEHTAELLEVQKANAFRVRSYQNAAEAVRKLDRDVSEMLAEGGDEAVQEIPGVGEKLAGAIHEIATTGRLGLAERLEGELSPGALFTRVPGIGKALALRIHKQLGIHTLEELETAAHDGRIDQVDGVGADRAEGIRVALSGMLSRSAQRKMHERTESGDGHEKKPAIELLLDIDRQYREEAEQDRLRKIAPKRFNPDNEQWLPIMNTSRDGWDFTALFSNTARAHERGKTHDWVVIYYEKDGRQKQCTVVTAERGKLKGKRAVRGRESECRSHYGV
jgi:ERCC4-type nuclease